MSTDNEVLIIMDAKSQNESFARLAAAGFAAGLNPTLTELADIKTAVSEAVTNAIIHGYDESKISGKVFLKFKATGDEIIVEVRDEGVGIEDIAMAREPLFTSKPELERSGMGFTVMETFMDSVDVQSQKGRGTWVTMTKKISRS